MFLRSIAADIKTVWARITSAFAPSYKTHETRISQARINLALATREEKEAAHEWQPRAGFDHARIVTKTSCSRAKG